MANEQNLKPFTGADDPRRMNGKPKGTKHLSTWIQDLLNDEDFDSYIQHPTKGWVPFKGAPGKAIVEVATRKALGGDDKAMEWLAKHGFGTKTTVVVEDPTGALLKKYEIVGGDNDGQTDEAIQGSPESSA